MAKNKDYFKILAKKIEVEVPKELDNLVLSSFPKKESSPLKNYFIPLGAAASLVFCLLTGWNFYQEKNYTKMTTIAKALEDSELIEKLDELELLTQHQDIELEHLSDKEWEILLSEDEDV